MGMMLLMTVENKIGKSFPASNNSSEFDGSMISKVEVWLSVITSKWVQ